MATQPKKAASPAAAAAGYWVTLVGFVVTLWSTDPGPPIPPKDGEAETRKWGEFVDKDTGMAFANRINNKVMDEFRQPVVIK